MLIPQGVGFICVKNKIGMSSRHNHHHLKEDFERANKLKILALHQSYKNSIFHWSWTHYSKSDFPMPYGYYAMKVPTSFGKSTTSSVTQKDPNCVRRYTKSTACMSTWSSTSWKRAAFVKELQKYMSTNCFI